jgi:hypothetical protein
MMSVRSTGALARALRMRSEGHRDFIERAMHTCRQRLLVRLPEHPTIAGYFWFAYFLALAALVFS